MKPKDIPEIKDAVEVLIRSELALPSIDALDDFYAVFEELDEYIREEQPNPEVIAYIGNIKNSHVRSLITNIVKQQHIDFTLYIHFFTILMPKIEKNIDWLRPREPALISELELRDDNSTREFRTEILQFIEKLKMKHKRKQLI